MPVCSNGKMNPLYARIRRWSDVCDLRTTRGCKTPQFIGEFG